MSMPGIPELIVIFAVLFLLFGGKKLPQLGQALGESIRNFKRGVKESEQPPKAELPKDPAAAPGHTAAAEPPKDDEKRA